MLRDVQALAVRRGLLAAAALTATVAAHHAATGHTGMYAGTPALWLGIVAVAMLAGSRAGRFRPRGPGTAAVTLAAAQLAAHAVLTQAPWALGLTGHAHVPLVTPGALIAHAAAALLLAVLLTGTDTALAALCGAARRIAAAMRGGRPGAPCPGGRAPAAAGLRARRARVPVRAPRGPPVPVVA
ncbi:MAG: hypothetical protein IT200_13235 [Thermoleophilia bacterium]|nr:hypothetical protein [Thermoleophilia bacterium]